MGMNQFSIWTSLKRVKSLVLIVTTVKPLV